MFGKRKRIKELEARIEELETCNVQAIKRYDKLRIENDILRAQLARFKGVLDNPKLKPAVSKFCRLCDYRVMFGSDVIGCCKGNVCEDFERRESNVPG